MEEKIIWMYLSNLRTKWGHIFTNKIKENSLPAYCHFGVLKRMISGRRTLTPDGGPERQERALTVWSTVLANTCCTLSEGNSGPQETAPSASIPNKLMFRFPHTPAKGKKS